MCPEFTVAEIERTPDTALQSKMKEAVSLLTLTDDVEVIANEYLSHGAVPNRNYDTCRIAIGVEE